jgi:VWFA-related protein
MPCRRIFVVLAFCLFLSSVLQAQRPGGRGVGSPPPGVSKGPGSGAAGPGPAAANRANLPSNPTVHHAEDEAKVEFRSETILVQVPVIVSNKSHIHIPGLSRTDFQVLENGKEQKIASFEEIETGHAPLTAAPPSKGEFSNLASSQDAPRNVTVIALDTINTPFLDQAYGRKQLVRYLANSVEPGQVSALVSISSRGTRVIHGLTANPAELMEALKKVSGELPALQGVDIDVQAAAVTGSDLESSPGDFLLNFNNTEQGLQDFLVNGDAAIARMQQDRAIESTMRAFLDIAWSLTGVPGKKSLVWATGGLPFYLDSAGAVPGGYLSVLYERTIQALNDAEISVYPIDVRGLVNYSPNADASYTGSKTPNAFAQNLAARGWLQTTTLDTLKDFADMTGGRAFYNSNDLASGFKRAADDSSSYYLLGYYLDTKNTKAGWRQLKVKVHKSGTEVRARSGFFVTNATVNPELAHKSDMTFALTSPFDSTGIPLTVRFKDVSADGPKKKVQFGLHVAPEGMALGGERNQLDLEVAVLAVTKKDGIAADSLAQTLKGAPNADTIAKLKADGLAYSNSLELPPGQYMVRFVIRDNFSGRIGSVSAPLTVN